MQAPRILMGTPICDIYEYCLDRYLDALKAQTIKADTLLVDNSSGLEFYNKLLTMGTNAIHVDPGQKRRVTVKDCRNLMIEHAIKNGYDYIFFVDADTIAPKDALEKLFSCGKDIVTGVVYNIYRKEGKRMVLPALWTWLKQDELDAVLKEKERYPEAIRKIGQYNIKSPDELRRQLKEAEILEPRVMNIRSCGAACLLVSRKAFMDTRFNFDRVGNQECTGEDIGFCNQATKNGHEIFANTGVVCKHLVKEKPINIFYE